MADPNGQTKMETASFAMGCFWSPDAMFGAIPGVIRTRVGYSGGTSLQPTYHEIDGHAETVQVDYDPQQVTYEDLLTVFWAHHSPFGYAYNGQYRSVIFVHSAAQREAAEFSLERRAAEEGRRPTTEIVDFVRFTRAEDYHQKYRLQNQAALFDEIRGRFSTFEEWVDSTLAARVNGYLSGWGSPEQLEETIRAYDLSPATAATLRAAIRDQGLLECPVPSI